MPFGSSFISAFAVEMDFTHTNMTCSFVRSHVFTKLMILAIPSIIMTIYRKLRDLGQNNHHSERLQTKYRRVQNGGGLFEACRKSEN